MTRKTEKYTNPFLKERDPFVAPVTSLHAHLQEATALHHKGMIGQAEAIYRQILEINPRSEDAFHLLGVIAHQRFQYQNAVDMIDLAIEINPTLANYHSNRGNALQALKQFDAAVASYDVAISLKPGYAEAYSNRGAALLELKQFEAAVTSCDKAIALNPNYAEAYLNRGFSMQKLKQLDAAVQSYDRAIILKPNFAEAYYNRGNALNELKQFEAAVASYDKVISLRPDYVEPFYNRANALRELEQFQAAVTSYDMAIALKPDYAEAYLNRGISLQELKQYESAVASYDKAIALKPDYAEAYSNRGISLQELKHLDAAVASYDKAIACNPSLAKIHSNKGVLLQELKKLDEAVASYDKAIALKPNFADAYANKSLLLLLVGDLDMGFKLNEYRWEREDKLKLKRNFSQPLWLGNESLSGKIILLHAEQGLGDTIQFCRYIKMVADLGAKVILEVQRPLVQLLKNLIGVSTLIAKGDVLHEFDFHCPLLSLPLAFHTNLKSIPFTESYLEAEPQRVVYWKERLNSDRLKIGIVWQGSHGNKIDIGRSFDLSLFAKFSALPNVQLISLQKGYGSEQMKNMPQGMEVMDLGEEFDADGAFLDTAAIMMNLDLVITSDTAMAHLAGALGVKAWVVLKYVPDWRWMLDRADSLWYPSLTLYRQQKMDDWLTIFDQLLLDITLIGESS